ncbi:MAG: redoxin domain-containing protein [Candidatus Nitrosotenuis sp.]
MQEGDKAPDFELPASDGTMVRLSSFKNNKNVVLCFYPKNHLFICPSKKVFEMAKSVVSAYQDIAKTDSVLFAISVDTVEDQKKFVSKYQIPYLHLSDTTKQVCKTYAELNMAGLAKRSTFIVDKNGVIRKIFRDFDVKTHGQQIAEAVANL